MYHSLPADVGWLNFSAGLRRNEPRSSCSKPGHYCARGTVVSFHTRRGQYQTGALLGMPGTPELREGTGQGGRVCTERCSAARSQQGRDKQLNTEL